MNTTDDEVSKLDKEVLTSMSVLVLFLGGSAAGMIYFIGHFVFGIW